MILLELKTLDFMEDIAPAIPVANAFKEKPHRSGAKVFSWIAALPGHGETRGRHRPAAARRTADAT